MFRKIGFVLLALLAWGSAYAAALPGGISPAMIEQFKSLPRAQQEQLAKQYGVDLSQITGSQGGEGTRQQSTVLQQRQVLPTDTSSKDDKTPDDNGAKKPVRYGLNLFNADISSFAPVDNAPVPDDYVVGPNDVINVLLFGKESQQLSLNVERDGTVNFPDLGPIAVGGLSFGKVKALLEGRVKEQMIGITAAVTLNSLRTISIFVAGEAKYPGAYAVPALTTVTQALFVAGGVSDIGSLRHIVVKRAGKTVTNFDLYDLLLRGNASDDIRLQSGDVVFIPPYTGIAEVKGEVRRPALYELNKDDTLADLLAMAGGAKAEAYPQASVLERINSQNLRDIQNVDLTNSKVLAEHVRGGDVLRVGVTSNRTENAVVLAGAVVRPGKYAWRKGMHVHDLVNSLWADLRLSADLDYALVVRQVNALGDIEVKQFAIGNAVTKPGSQDDIALSPKDVVLVFNYDDANLERTNLNKYITKQLQPVLDKSSDERWLSDDLLAKGIQSIQDNAKQKDVKSVAGFAIKDAATDKQQTQQELTQERLADGTIVSVLSEATQNLLSRIFVNPDLMALTPELKRQELLFPVLEKLKNQARSGSELQVVSISGDVKVPGEYPLASGANIRSLITAAGGLNASAYLGRAELTRAQGTNKDINGIQVAHRAVDISDAVKGGVDNIALASRDHLNVFSTPDWQVDRTVEIRGEVRFPGSYTVHRGETLDDVLQRAGGVTQYAFVDGAVFTRKQVQDREKMQVNKLIEQLRSDVATRALSADTTTVSYQDAMAMIGELQKIQPVGRLVIDLPHVLAGDRDADMQVEDGDILYIPRKTSTVTVVGEVQHASSHRFKPGMSVEDYLNLSGGFRKRADEDRVYVIRADGSVMIPGHNSSWFASNSDQLKAGDTIVVPLDTEYMNNLTTWSSVTQIIYQSAVALAAIATL
ncbi:protein involved in polysaccharide export with SLBB domain [Gallaecimonas pentaromativorans]|uniref:Protein involved in polysaccharide export with SLBB domain n=2 Tax=Gallaecimonas pentaromativorans TaxID=584787 RepID=A0A3N1P2B0_9GAMM|nr:protein involved in polysaccharide export with SLBB domain [Gallaecimonas pentaromativorans]